MYLKTLTIRGFKSFASKTTFEFEPGVTSVIGPNGSGKSNVVDALAWVMGEQGVKNLRGGKMEDVIFAGTTGRAPLGRAQVELTIDNSDGTLPIDYSEVTISRTLFRSGGSEYHINGEAARLLDIQELLSDSGLGREMHVIVGQGQLDRILQATPEERRGFIEEAAGILKHRRRKERSERKLQSMRANLDRLRDLTEEVHRQLGPLSRQANTARKAQRVQHDVRDATSRLLADDIVTASSRLQELLDADNTLEEQHERLTQQLEEAEKRSQELATRTQQTTQAAASARDHRYQLRSLAERFRSLQALAKERLKTNTRPAVASSGLSPEEAETQLVENQQAFEESRQKQEELTHVLNESVVVREQAEKQVRVARETYTQLVREEAEQQKSFVLAESRKASAETKLQSIEAQVARITQDESLHAESYTDAEQEISSDKQTLAEVESELRQQREQETKARDQEQEARQQLKTAEGVANELRNAQSAAQARVEVLAQSLQPVPGSAKASIANIGGQDFSEILDIEPGWEKAIAALLSGSTESLWLNTWTVGYRAAEKLQHEEAPDVRIFFADFSQPSSIEVPVKNALQLSEILRPRDGQHASFETLRSYFASSIAVESLEQVQELLQSQDLFSAYPELRIATKQGDLVTRHWVEVRGDGTTSSLEQRAAYDRAVADADHVANTLEQARLEVQAAAQRHEALIQARQKYASAIQQLQAQGTTLRERIKLQTRTIDEQRKAQKRRAEHQEKLHRELAEARKVYEQATERFEALQAAASLVGATAGGTEEAAAAQQEVEQNATTARARETEARLALRTAENVTQQAEQRVEQSRRRLSAVKIAHQEYQRALARQHRMRQRLTALSEGIESAIQHIEQSVTRAESDHTTLESQRAEMATQLENSEKAIARLRKELAQVQDNLHERRLVRQEHEIKLEQLRERALTELGYSHEYLVKNFGPDQPVDTGDNESTVVVFYDRQEQQNRLRTAKRNLSALGKINPLALEEYAAVKERHEYLTQQLEDLETSRRDLLKIIEDVNQTVLKVFTSAYEDTAAQFEHVFATLFPGGEGRLSLTEPDNMLETGIEVEARPAGKKVKRLSLLSGGERSLAAIAMLVSIFKARPSPFYVMDEVEAALDDTNLTRLLTIFKELQVDSQLIIITHQKRTMEISDALYGVSMRGDGVSQVISQKLDHV
ncbi:chromosome segregation protein SMC [Enteractinococcus coprophilus]|uniref:Chromosome partition protein Smc n=1 Tax=Enteractinococcus coprophilus TaxID=1027633 RepID=A0A543AIL2_9MICC|nr:chromosome segregation protein SMC [Enteractinococcus coprophilus]TQL72427.1 condensin subunit Smc [Enteractinococcus coprophilus]